MPKFNDFELDLQNKTTIDSDDIKVIKTVYDCYPIPTHTLWTCRFEMCV